MSARPLEKEEIRAVENNDKYLVPGLPLKRSVIVDISGGGIRFVGDYCYEPDSLVCCKYNLATDGKSKECLTEGTEEYVTDTCFKHLVYVRNKVESYTFTGSGHCN